MVPKTSAIYLEGSNLSDQAISIVGPWDKGIPSKHASSICCRWNDIIHNQVRRTDELTFAHVQMESNIFAESLNAVYVFSHLTLYTAQGQVIQVAQIKFWRQLLQQRMQCVTEKKGSKWISLLWTFLRLDYVLTEEKFWWLQVGWVIVGV